MTDEIIKEYRRPELGTPKSEGSGEKIKKFTGAKLSAVKSALSNIKKPKFVTLGILLATAIVVILAMNLVSLEEKEQPPTVSQEISSPSPTPSADTSLENIAQRVKTYSDKLDSLEQYQKKLIYPIVDLDISFD